MRKRISLLGICQLAACRSGTGAMPPANVFARTSAAGHDRSSWDVATS